MRKTFLFKLLQLTRSFNGHWHDCSIVNNLIVQQSLAQLFYSHRHDYSTVLLTRLFYYHLYFFQMARFFNSQFHCDKLYHVPEIQHMINHVTLRRNTTHDKPPHFTKKPQDDLRTDNCMANPNNVSSLKMPTLNPPLHVIFGAGMKFTPELNYPCQWWNFCK